MLRRALGSSLAAALLLGACGDGAARGLQPPVQSSTPAPGDTRSFYKVMLTMEVAGAETVSLAKEAIIDVHEIVGQVNPVAIWFLTVSAGQHISTGDGTIVGFSADLAPGSYRGPGDYKIDGGTAEPVLGVTPNLGSASYVSLLKGTDFRRYATLVEPCTMRFEKDAASGEVVCPALGNDDRSKTVSARWSWRRL